MGVLSVYSSAWVGCVYADVCVSHIQSLCDSHILQILANFNDHFKFHE